jgi:hypothetical protein
LPRTALKLCEAMSYELYVIGALAFVHYYHERPKTMRRGFHLTPSAF